MYFGFALDALVIDLDLLDTDILNKHFACLQDVLKKSLRHAFKTPSRHILMTKSSAEQFFIFQDIVKTKNFYAEYVLKTSSRHVLRTKKCLLGNESAADIQIDEL